MYATTEGTEECLGKSGVTTTLPRYSIGQREIVQPNKSLQHKRQSRAAEPQRFATYNGKLLLIKPISLYAFSAA